MQRPACLNRYAIERMTLPDDTAQLLSTPPPSTPPEQPRFRVDGHDLTLLDTGPRRLEALLALIEGARVSLRILYYIYTDDAAGRRVRDAMIAAARRGVAVSAVSYTHLTLPTIYSV